LQESTYKAPAISSGVVDIFHWLDHGCGSFASVRKCSRAGSAPSQRVLSLWHTPRTGLGTADCQAWLDHHAMPKLIGHESHSNREVALATAELREASTGAFPQ
jgi:hypothetical protein